jgi:predicted DNA-binding transcriptional regulator YafY
MSKTDRLLFILNLIRSRKNYRAKDLAKECGVSERTIYRDIITLSSAHVPIYFNDGYKFLADAFLPPLNFSLDGYVTLYLGLNSEIVNSSPAVKESGKRALAKLESLIPESLKDEYLKIKQKIDIELKSQNQDSKCSLIFSLLKQALIKEIKVELKLLSEKSTKIVKDVIPEKLLNKGGDWFLVATIGGKREEIKINQIKDVTF